MHPELSQARRSSRGEAGSRRIPRALHPEIPSITEGEELSMQAIPIPRSQPMSTSGKVGHLQHNNHQKDEDRSLDELYDIAPGYLELEAPEELADSCPKRTDRSLSLPAVHGNFRLLRRINQRYTVR